MAYYKTEAILLRRHSLGEADRILTLLSPDVGKIRAVAKGVRRGRSKLAGHLEPFVVSDVRMAKGRNLDVITSAQGKQYFNPADGDLGKLALAHLLLEICDKILPEDEPQPEVFDLLLECLSGLQNGLDPQLVRHYFYVRLLQPMGHRPELTTDHGTTAYYLLLQSGQLSVQPTDEASAKMSPDQLKLWRLIFSNPLSQVARVVNAVDLALEAQSTAERFYDYQFGVRFRSEQILA